MDAEYSRWMPPSPAREAILWELQRGRAHLEERGHGLSPLFVYEDGGAMELALMRIEDGHLVAVADAGLPESSTKHIDVCGTVDELERLWREHPEHADTALEEQLSLLDNALGMLARMDQRLTAYREFADTLAAVVGEMAELQPPDHLSAPGLAADLRAHMSAGGAHIAEHRAKMVELAEAIRKIAGDSEQVLYRYRDLAIRAGALYDDIRGAREWSKRDG